MSFRRNIVSVKCRFGLLSFRKSVFLQSVEHRRQTSHMDVSMDRESVYQARVATLALLTSELLPLLVRGQLEELKLSRNTAKTNKVTCAPSEGSDQPGQVDQSSQCTQWVANYPSFLHADSEDSDQTGLMPRLIWTFAGRTSYCVSFVVLRLSYINRNSLNGMQYFDHV